MKGQEEWKIWPPHEIFYIESLLTKTKTAVDSSFIFLEERNRYLTL